MKPKRKGKKVVEKGWMIHHIHTPYSFCNYFQHKKEAIDFHLEDYSFKNWKEAETSGWRCLKVIIREQ